MVTSEKDTINMVIGYVLKSLLAIVGFFLTLAGRQMVQVLCSIQKDVLQLKIELTEIKASMMSEQRVRQLIHLQKSKTP